MFHVKHHLRFLPNLGTERNALWIRLGAMNYTKVAGKMGKKRWQWEYNKSTQMGSEFFPFHGKSTKAWDEIKSEPFYGVGNLTAYTEEQTEG